MQHISVSSTPLDPFIVIKPSSGSTKLVGDHREVAVHWEFSADSSTVSFNDFTFHVQVHAEEAVVPDCVLLGMLGRDPALFTDCLQFKRSLLWRKHP